MVFDGTPALLGSTTTRPDDVSALAALVHHHDTIESHCKLGEAQKHFERTGRDFLAITREGTVTGLSSRLLLGVRLGSRFGFALHGDEMVSSAACPRPLIVGPTTPLSEVLDRALSRQGTEFFEDVILVDAHQKLLGLVPVPALAQLQLQLFRQQLRLVTERDDVLRQRNLDLFQSNHLLRQSQGRYKVLFDNNALGVVLLDPSGAIIAHNRKFEEILRLDQRPAPEYFSLDSWVAPADRDRLRSILQALEIQPESARTEIAKLRFNFAEGTRTFDLHCSWVRETGQICTFIEDITEQQILEEQLARQEKQAMLDTLVAGVAHELNNKLTPVLGYAELLEMTAPPALRSQTGCIRQSSREAAQIIKQLLNIARPTEVEFASVDLAALCREAMLMLRFQLRETGCSARLEAPSDAVCALGNPAQLKQVLINLMLNACHAMETRSVRELVLAVEKRPGAAWLHVRDTGSGIKAEHLARIFDPFFTTKGPRGTGLGLSISSSIVRQHGGEILVESTPEQGATFSIRLPAQLSPVARLADSNSPFPTRPVNASRRRVLVVDDEEFVRQFLQEALRMCFGCSVETAVDGEEAIKRLDRAYDLVLTDIRMPGLNGIQLRGWIAEHRPDLANRVVFITGHAGTAELEEALRHVPGAVVIRKPCALETLLSACRPYLAPES
jgi:signal transduction histidine kinase